MDVAFLCGDVGFMEKQKVAFVAAFKAIKEWQASCFFFARNNPLLSFQHFENAVERFKGFGVQVELLNRFKTIKEQKKF